jgi:uncharacterized surface protein with fasciclin (FAS1) repeats
VPLGHPDNLKCNNSCSGIKSNPCLPHHLKFNILAMFSTRILILAVIVGVANAFGAGKALRILRNTALNANIIETATAAGNFKTLLSLVKAAGLDGVLAADAKLTVFAPTDEAFAKIPAESLANLAKDPVALANVLKYHVHPGTMNPTRTGRTLDTLLMGEDSFPKQLTVKVTNWECESFIFAGQEKPAKVTTMGIKCDNGLIHEITEVLLPYEGNVPPSVTFIGKGGITIEKTLQLSYYGPEAGKGRDPEGIKGGADKEYAPISVGDEWKRAGNWDNALGYFDDSVEYHKGNSVAYNKDKEQKK